MAWSAPMTAVSNTAFTAAQFNQYVRDNLNETAPAKATQAGQIFVSTAANSISARLVTADFVGTSDTTTSAGSYTDLASTTGPTVTVTTAASAIVAIYCNMFNTAGNAAWMSYDISGATTNPSDDNRSVQMLGSGGQHVGATFFHSAILTPGSNTFTAKYRVSASGTGTFSSRRLMVIPM